MRFSSCGTLAIIALFLLGATPGNATSPLDLSADDSLAQKVTGDGKKLVELAYKIASDLRDYKFESVLYMCKPKPHQSGAGTYFFKRPNLVKLEIKSFGIKDGTVVVRQPDGRIRVVGGPKLRFLKMNLDEDSRMLQTPNGFNVIKSDFASLLAGVNAALASGSKAKATPAPVLLDRLKQNVSIVELIKPDKGEEKLTDRIFIDPQTYTPVEWDIFRNGDRYSVTLFENFNANIGLQDDQFQL
jgi:outer membrane lipoprotein-sorting protein